MGVNCGNENASNSIMGVRCVAENTVQNIITVFNFMVSRVMVNKYY